MALMVKRGDIEPIRQAIHIGWSCPTFSAMAVRPHNTDINWRRTTAGGSDQDKSQHHKQALTLRILCTSSRGKLGRLSGRASVIR